jgi:type I restriction enzyme S subunit
VGAYCGNVHITVSPAWVTDNAILVEELSSAVKPDFLVHVLDEVGLNRFAEQSAQPRISQSTLRNLKIPIPSEEEQEKIVDSLRKMKEATESEMRYQNDLQLLKKGLMQDLLTGKVRTADKAIDVLDEVEAHG